MKLDEIARLAGVSKTTASYVINGKAEQYRISQKTQDKVMAVVEAHNYRPNHAASSLRAGSSRSFGLIIPDLENSSYARLAKLLERDARAAGYQLIISCSDDEPETEKQVADNLIIRRIDALFVASCLHHQDPFYKTIQDKGTPVIALDRIMDDEHFGCVISENFDGAKTLANALPLAEIQSLGLIGAVAELNVSIERERGVLAALETQNIAPSVLYGEAFTREEGYRVAMQWIASDSLPGAVLCTAYPLFEGVLDAMVAHPELFQRTHFATFGDNRLLDFLPIKVHSLAQRFELIADAALTIALTALSAGKPQPGIELIPRQLKIR
uniref:catabolite repressor/activator n=1 Tax=Thaumasiovibrio occultus TaxID=1891184 RepID=UPI000B35222D|nr:catabolite repressor/activator [Thaumasiovibrio occultus]